MNPVHTIFYLLDTFYVMWVVSVVINGIISTMKILRESEGWKFTSLALWKEEKTERSKIRSLNIIFVEVKV